MELKKVLENVMKDNEPRVDDSFELLNRLIATKKLECRSDKTLKYYQNTVYKMLQVINKNVKASNR